MAIGIILELPDACRNNRRNCSICCDFCIKVTYLDIDVYTTRNFDEQVLAMLLEVTLEFLRKCLKEHKTLQYIEYSH